MRFRFLPSRVHWPIRLPRLFLLLPIFMVGATPTTATKSPFPVNLSLRVEGVTLYGNMAVVRRKGSVVLSKGEGWYVVEDLPGGLIDSSIRLQPGEASMRIRSVKVESVHRKMYASKEAADAERMLRETQKMLQILLRKYSIVTGEKKSLLSMQIPGTEKEAIRKAKVESDSWIRSLDFIRKELKENSNRSLDLQEQIRRAREDEAVARLLLERYGRVSYQTTKRVLFLLENRSPGSAFPLSLEYRVGDAGWYPVYTARLKEKGDGTPQLEWVASALLRNHTGEPWDNVRIDLSAAEPEGDGSLPVLKKWTLSSAFVPALEESSPLVERSMEREGAGESVRDEERKPMQEPPPPAPSVAPSERRDRRAGALSSSAGGAAKAESSPLEGDGLQLSLNRLSGLLLQRDGSLERGEFGKALEENRDIQHILQSLPSRYGGLFRTEKEEALRIARNTGELLESQNLRGRLVLPRIARGGFDVSFTLPDRVSVPSDGLLHRSFLYEKKMNASLTYETSPVTSPRVYLMASVVYRDEAPLLAGPVSLFLEGAYAGESSTGSVGNGEEIRLSMGGTEDIRVERSESEFQETGGLFGREQRTKMKITIHVRNGKRKAADLTVYDRIPVSEDARIRVGDVHVAPPTTSIARDGLYTFRLHLAPGEKGVVTLEYTLSREEGILPLFHEGGGDGL